MRGVGGADLEADSNPQPADSQQPSLDNNGLKSADGSGYCGRTEADDVLPWAFVNRTVIPSI